MKISLSIPLLLSLLVLVLNVDLCYADSGSIDLPSMGRNLGSRLGVGDVGGGLLMMIIVMMIVMLPTLILTMKANHSGVIIFMLLEGFSIMCFAIAIGWAPFWILLIIGMLIALMYASKMRQIITGGADHD